MRGQHEFENQHKPTLGSSVGIKQLILLKQLTPFYMLESWKMHGKRIMNHNIRRSDGKNIRLWRIRAWIRLINPKKMPHQQKLDDLMMICRSDRLWMFSQHPTQRNSLYLVRHVRTRTVDFELRLYIDYSGVNTNTYRKCVYICSRNITRRLSHVERLDAPKRERTDSSCS